MGKHKTSNENLDDDEYTPGCEGKRPYQFVSDTVKVYFMKEKTKTH